MQQQPIRFAGADADRLQTIENRAHLKKVALSKRDIDDARRLLALLAGQAAAERDPVSPHASGPPEQQRDDLISEAKRELSRRRSRSKIFGKAMFGEPAWDMLLLLYASQETERLTATRLALLSGGSKATALRWIEYLVSQKWVDRSEHPTDKRSVFVTLSERGREMLEQYLQESVGLTR